MSYVFTPERFLINIFERSAACLGSSMGKAVLNAGNLGPNPDTGASFSFRWIPVIYNFHYEIICF